MENEKGQVVDWLNEIISNPDGWKQWYSESEVKSLAEIALKLIDR